MPSHPVSLRNVRKAVSNTIDQANAHHDAILQIARKVDQHTALLARDFLGRLRWLLRGK